MLVSGVQAARIAAAVMQTAHSFLSIVHADGDNEIVAGAEDGSLVCARSAAFSASWCWFCRREHANRFCLTDCVVFVSSTEHLQRPLHRSIGGSDWFRPDRRRGSAQSAARAARWRSFACATASITAEELSARPHGDGATFSCRRACSQLAIAGREF